MLLLNFSFKHFSEEEKDELKNYLDKKTQRIERLLDKERLNQYRLEVKAERFATKSAYKINFILHVPQGKILAREDDHTIREAVDLALDKLTSRLKKSFDKI